MRWFEFPTALFGGAMVKSIIFAVDSNNADAQSVLNNEKETDPFFEDERNRKEMMFLVKMLDTRGALDVEL